MKDEFFAMIDEARASGNVEEKIRQLWGTDGVYVYKIGELDGWRRGHVVTRFKMLAFITMGFGAAVLVQAFL